MCKTDINENQRTDTNENLLNDGILEFPKTLNDVQELEWISTLGMGAFSTVELVSINNKQFALKRFKDGVLGKHESMMQVENEVLILRKCNGSTFVVKYHGSMLNQPSPCILLEPCLGGDLLSVMQKSGALSNETAKFYSACVIEGLKYLELSGIFYRDLKPENLLLDEAGYVKIADLGLSKFIRGKSEKTFTIVGTAEYLSPEMLNNQGYNLASTLWSLGILIYEMLTGSPPFVANDQKKLFSKIRAGFNSFTFPSILSINAVEIIRMLCRPKPSQRPGLELLTRYMWFVDFDWDALRKRVLDGPIIDSELDEKSTVNFDLF